jgi:hypothetical protein
MILNISKPVNFYLLQAKIATEGRSVIHNQFSIFKILLEINLLYQTIFFGIKIAAKYLL